MTQFYSMIDKSGKIIRPQYTDNADASVPEGCRLLPDTTPQPLPTVENVTVEYWQRVEPVPPAATSVEYRRVARPADAIAADFREARNHLLRESDWTMLPRSRLTEAQVEAWAEYRDRLRDLPDQAGFPLSVRFPVAP